jgi:flavin-dependent dehydrogenase
MIDPKTIDVDVLIVGGGMAGCALAYALAHKYSVLVLEKEPETSRQDRIGESLPAAALRSLKSLGLSDAIDLCAHSDYHGVVSIWGQSTPIRKDFFDTLDGSGLHVDRGLLNRAIKKAAVGAGVGFIQDAQLSSLSSNNDDWAIEVDRPDEHYQIQARIVVDASGRASVVARKLGMRRVNTDRAVAIHAQCTRMKTGQTSPQLTYQGLTLIEAVENGWWYRAPLPSGKYIISFHTDSDLPITSFMQKPRVWLDALRSTKLINDGVELCQESALKLTVCAANSSFPKQCAGDNWLAIGDAALAFDPLSSQGMFNALTTALLAKQAIYEVLDGNSDATASYARKIARVCNVYQQNLTEFYRTEARWRESLFWKRRFA